MNVIHATDCFIPKRKYKSIKKSLNYDMIKMEENIGNGAKDGQLITFFRRIKMNKEILYYILFSIIIILIDLILVFSLIF